MGCLQTLEMPSSIGFSIRSSALEHAGRLLLASALLLACKKAPPPAPPWNGIAEDPEPRSAWRIRSLVASSAQVCALYNDGGVACWGRGAEIALGRSIPEGTAARVFGVTGARRLAVGDCNACALDEEGHMTCWGHRGLYCEQARPDLGGTLLLPKPQRITDIPKMRVITGQPLGDGITAIGEDGELWSFGTSCDSYSVSPGGSDGVCRSVSFYTFRHSHDGSPYDSFTRAAAHDATDLAKGEMECARNASGHTRCYSGNITGGDGQPFAALQAPNETVSRMSTSYRETCFVLASGTVECRSTEGIVIPKLPGPARTAASDGIFGCATGHDGSLSCWKAPPLATGQTSPAPVLTPEVETHDPAAGARLVVATGFDLCTLSIDDTVTCGVARGASESRRITLP